MNAIIHPITGKTLSVFSDSGKQLLKHYVNLYQLQQFGAGNLEFGDDHDDPDDDE